VRAELARLDAEVMATEAQLSDQGGDDVGDALTRLEALRERTRGLANVLSERRRGIERDRDAQVDRGVIANLESDAARLRAELETVERAAAALVPELERLGEAESELGEARARFAAQWADGVAPPSGKAAELRGELGALRAAFDRGLGERSRLGQRATSISGDLAAVDAELERVRHDTAQIQGAEAELVGALRSAEERAERAEAALSEAQEALHAADADWNSWSSRADALALALDEARARAGAERLAGVPGVVGTLLDLIDVDEGWQAAFEAAAGEALAAVVVDGVDAARDALETLRRGDLSGAVLALGAAGAAVAPPPVGEPVRRHVRSRHSGVTELLDALVGGAVVVDGDLFAGIDVVLAHPGSVVVTRSGDRLGVTGWRVGEATGPRPPGRRSRRLGSAPRRPPSGVARRRRRSTTRPRCVRRA
jgi:chromosome segregation protein